MKNDTTIDFTLAGMVGGAIATITYTLWQDWTTTTLAYLISSTYIYFGRQLHRINTQLKRRTTK